MTPFRNDAQNPFGRRSAWPTMPQTPLPVPAVGRRWRRAGERAPPGLDEVIVVAAEPEPEIAAAEPVAAPEPPLFVEPTGLAPPNRRRRRSLRLMPLMVSGALGVCGLAALFVVILRP